jgi:hypothetical protein
MLCSSQTAGIQIAAFAEREHSFGFVKQFSEADCMFAVATQLDNPWHTDVFIELIETSRLFEALRAQHPESASLALRDALRKDYRATLELIDRLGLPEDRMVMYKGHAAMRHGEYADAVAAFDAARRLGNNATFLQATKHLFPLDQLITAVIAPPSLDKSELSIPIVLEIYTRRACAEYQNRAFRDLACKRVQVDEIWAFIYAKQVNIPNAKVAPEEAGDAWTWTAICADSKLIFSWMVGGRDASYATVFMHDVRSRLANRVQLTSDGPLRLPECCRGHLWMGYRLRAVG